MALSRDLTDSFNYLTIRANSNQAGIIAGADPTGFNTADPLRLWILQVAIIVATSQILGWFLRKIRQPKVISEVLGGIILGPTVMGRISHFTEHIFPAPSLPFLSLTANIGLVLFMFFVGLEIDMPAIKRNGRISSIIGVGGMLLPFGVGSGMSQVLYRNFIPSTINSTHFLLFTAVSYSITAFPVLCRILTELKLLDTTVELCVLSAGVGIDIFGWSLLALIVALVNATTALTALYVILTALAWILFLLFPVRFALAWFARRTSSVEHGPSVAFMTVVIVLVFGSAFFTDVIGVHAIFGGFLVGIIVPRENGVAIALTEKLEDLVHIIFLPLYFILSGLSTDLGLLNTGKTWAFTLLIILTDWSGKFAGASIGATVAGFKPREAATVGSLMSCKGLVELIVLNMGLQTGVLTKRVFTMFVLSAVGLTFLTTPVVVALYPPHLRKPAYGHMSKKRMSGIENVPSTAGEKVASDAVDEEARGAGVNGSISPKTRFLVVLDKLEHLPGAMRVIQLLTIIRDGALNDIVTTSDEESRNQHRSSSPTQLIQSVQSRHNGHLNTSGSFPPIALTALRLLEVTDRTSGVMKSFIDTLPFSDDMLRIMKTFGELSGIPVTTEFSLINNGEFGEAVEECVQNEGSEMVVLAWSPSYMQNRISMQKQLERDHAIAGSSSSTSNPFGNLFRTSSHVSLEDGASSAVQIRFLRGVFARSTVSVGLFVDRRSRAFSTTSSDITTYSHRRLFLPFFGGTDERSALEFVVQLCQNHRVNATIVRFIGAAEGGSSIDRKYATVAAAERESASFKSRKGKSFAGRVIDITNGYHRSMAISSLCGAPDTLRDDIFTAQALQSKVADDLVWQRHTSHPHPRIKFEINDSLSPLSTLLGRIVTECEIASFESSNSSRLLCVVGRNRRTRLNGNRFPGEFKSFLETLNAFGKGKELNMSIGDVATTIACSGLATDILVIQAAKCGDD